MSCIYARTHAPIYLRGTLTNELRADGSLTLTIARNQGGLLVESKSGEKDLIPFSNLAQIKNKWPLSAEVELKKEEKPSGRSTQSADLAPKLHVSATRNAKVDHSPNASSRVGDDRNPRKRDDRSRPKRARNKSSRD